MLTLTRPNPLRAQSVSGALLEQQSTPTQRGEAEDHRSLTPGGAAALEMLRALNRLHGVEALDEEQGTWALALGVLNGVEASLGLPTCTPCCNEES